MQDFNKHLESNNKLVEVMEYLVKDQAFDNQFIVTAILEYYEYNMQKQAAKNPGVENEEK